MRKTCGKYLPKDEYCPAIFCSIPFFHEQKSGFFVVSADEKTRLMTANESSIERKEHYTVYYQIDSMLPPNHRRKLMQSYFVKQ